MNIGEKIQKLRKKNDLSQEEVAEKLRITRQSISKWESGQSVPEISKVIQLSELFGVSTDYLLKDSDDEKNNGSLTTQNSNFIMKNRMTILLISVFITIVLVLAIWDFSADVSDHNNDKYINSFIAMGTFAAVAENYLDAESYEERKEIGQLLDKEFLDIVNSRRGVIRIYTPFLGGDQTFDRIVSDLIIYVFNPLWSLTYILPEDRPEDAILERGKELNEDEAAFFTELLNELKEFKFIKDHEIDNLNRRTRNEIIDQSRELIERAQELDKEYLNEWP